MRKAVKDNNVVFQLGHHENSDPNFVKAREICRSGQLGKMPLVRTYIDRTSAWPEWQFYTRYDNQVLPADANEKTIEWERFQRNSAVKTKFDPERFFRWRCWWEYGTGISGDLMSHQWDSINMVVGMGIPEAMQTQGALYFWKQDREVPDQWHVLMEYPKKELTVTFACSFHNSHHGTCTYLFGREATIEVSSDFCRVFAAEWKPEYAAKATRARREAVAQGRGPHDIVIPPDYSLKPGELKVTSHMQDFIDCIRTGAKTRCDIDRGFEEAVTVVMAVESFRKERKVRWDAVKEEFV
jgi:predicted dehydrogenase